MVRPQSLGAGVLGLAHQGVWLKGWVVWCSVDVGRMQGMRSKRQLVHAYQFFLGVNMASTLGPLVVQA